jgi:hypothetical protein
VKRLGEFGGAGKIDGKVNIKDDCGESYIESTFSRLISDRFNRTHMRLCLILRFPDRPLDSVKTGLVMVFSATALREGDRPK